MRAGASLDKGFGVFRMGYGMFVLGLSFAMGMLFVTPLAYADEVVLYSSATDKPPPAMVAKGETVNLQKCVEIALERQPNILAARNAQSALQGRVGQAKAGYYPKVDLSAGYNKTQPVPSPLIRTAPGIYDQYTASASLTQTLYDFGKTSALVGIQRYGLDAAESDLENTRLSIIYGVKVAYYGYLQAGRNVAVGEETVLQLKKHMEQAQAFFAAGTRPKYDVTKAEVDLSNAKLALMHAVNYVRLAKLNLDNAMGIPGATDFSLVDDMDYRKYNINLEDSVARAYTSRPDIRSMMAKKHGAEESLDLAKRGYYPTLSGYAQYNWAGTALPLSDGWNVGVSLTLPLFSGFSTSYQVQESRANYDLSVSNEEQLRQNVFYEVHQAYLNMKEAEERISSSELVVRQVQEVMDMAIGRYGAGVGTPIEVTDAQIALSNAKTTYIQSLSDYKLAQAALEKAIGGR